MQNSEHGVQAPNAGNPLSRVRWDDLRVFAATARHPSLRAAADAQRLSVNTVRTAVARVEEQIGATLLRRSRSGIQLTEAGEQLLEQIREMGRFEPVALGNSGDTDVLIKPGELRISCSDALGSLWLAPKLGELCRLLPDLRLNLQLAYDLARDRSADNDIGLTYHLPSDPDLIVSRLATIHMIMCASPAYIARHGAPTSFEELRSHRYVEHVSEGVNTTIIDHIVGQHRPKGFGPICSNSAITQFWAVAQGQGLGIFPTYCHVLSDQVVPIDLPIQLRFELYYYYHASARRSPSVQTSIGWLKNAFSPDRNPWFSDRFVHPRDFGPLAAKLVLPLEEVTRGNLNGTANPSA